MPKKSSLWLIEEKMYLFQAPAIMPGNQYLTGFRNATTATRPHEFDAVEGAPDMFGPGAMLDAAAMKQIDSQLMMRNYEGFLK